MVIHQSGGEVELLCNRNQKSNPALGLFDAFEYGTATIKLTPGDRFIFYTDGVYDVEKNGELLSIEWLQGALHQRAHLALPDIFDDLLAELRSFSSEEFQDDMCLVGMEVKGLL
jgi:serine phosphatase RsbU (regulator of sigma subunit)